MKILGPLLHGNLNIETHPNFYSVLGTVSLSTGKTSALPPAFRVDSELTADFVFVPGSASWLSSWAFSSSVASVR